VAQPAEAGLCKTLSTRAVGLNQIVMPLLCNIVDLGFYHSYDLADICAPQSDLNHISCSHFEFSAQQAVNMWLLHTTELRVQQFSPGDVPKYAILSHRWEQEEVTFQDMKSETFTQLKGFSKLQGCCERAAGDGYSWVWIDTCCIDKTSSAELSEAINSMYRWYRDSAICYAYLSDIQDPKDLATSKWFLRGWTLQELVAPRRISLFDGQWRDIGTKHLLAEQISSITTIPKNTLLGTSPFRCNAAQRMSWASTRQTTREEDMAYCLMGLFDVHMLPIYGEGLEKAFLRLQEEILKRSSDQTLFLWPPSNEPYNQGLLATSPRAFCTHYDCFPWLTAVETIPRKGFSPYSLFRPSIFAPSSQSFDERSLSNCFRYEDPDHALSLVSLGPRGLQISLLSGVDEAALDTKVRIQRPRIISLDVFFVFERYHTKITLLLVPDVRLDYTSIFLPYRLGEMRREVCTDPASNPRLYFPLSSKRSTLTISQMRNAGPGSPVSFIFRNSRSRALAGEVKIFHMGTSTDIVSDLTEPFICSGGSIEVKHSCRDCSVQGKLVLFYGTRGQPSQPWCTLSVIPSSEFIQDFYRNIELLSARSHERSNIGMRCDKVLLVEIQPTADENLYTIAMEIQNTMEIVATYGLEEEKL
jgi:hypothetical protein